MEKNLRTIPLHVSGLHVREQGGKQSRVIEGHAVVFGVRSVNLTPWSDSREIYEVIEPGAITKELINRSDVVLTAFHNNEKILGRSVKGKGTLTLSIDKKGLFIRCELPQTATADELLEALNAQTKNSNFIKLAIRFRGLDFATKVIKKLENSRAQILLDSHLAGLHRKGLIALDDYSLAIL